ncbi:PAS domain S-box protein [Spirosoma validum]|uniref:histidine kinase n=1 Tax=Spirosoma validum TaxID=2771355 RepID=A0A927AZF1_9BACT|nr:PAS domain S-box protein [Spirosoma validum]MBD2752689.1 PAS domain S-box protein [Spirosoma validum]
MRVEEIYLLTQSVQREREARLQAEKKLSQKIDELSQTKEQFRLLNDSLTQQIAEKVQELRRSDQEHRQLIESVHDIIYKVSPIDGTFTYVSPVVERTLGYMEEELLGKPYNYLVIPDYRGMLHDFYMSMLRDKVDNTYQEFPVLCKDGSQCWIGQTVRLVTNEDGKWELVAVARNITDQKEIEKALVSAQIRLTTVISSSVSAVMIEDENHAIVLINRMFCDLFGLNELDFQQDVPICSIPFRLVAHLFEEPEKERKRVNDLLQNRRVVLGEEVCMADGRQFERDFIPVFRDDQYMGHLWRYTDVTEKYLAREQLRKSEEKYRGIMNNMELGLLEVDNNQTIVRAYERFCQMLGYTSDELIGQNAAELLLTPAAREVVARQQVIRKQGLATSYEIPLRHKNGQTLWVLISGSPIMDEHGTIIGSIGIHYNLTERKQLEIEVAQAHKLAEESRQAEKQFLANMSHEIRTPLNAIIGMTHLLYDTRPSQEQLEYLDIIRSSADFLHSLISDLLDMAKIEAGRVEVHREPFDLAGLLRSLQKIFQMRLQKRPVVMDVMLDARISGKYIGDELMLNQILLNLLGNAEKFTEEGSIVLTARVRKKEATRTWIEFQVSDTGIGIPSDKVERVFQKFRQISPQGHKHKGTGLGLAITKELVELQEGKISVRSEEGEGSVFTFSLPYELVMTEENTPEEILANETTGKVENMTILVAEDNLMNQRYVSGLLKKWGVTFTIANDGQQAVDICRKQKFDLILMDIQMPVLTGYEATIAIRSIDNLNQQTAIVALTASAMLDQKEMAIKVGMDGFLSKPFPPDKLLTVLKQYATEEQAQVVGHVASGVVTHPLDYDRLSELYGDDTDYAASMFETFLETVLTEFDAFDILIQQQRWDDVRQLAHKLKPTLGMVGLSDLEAMMIQLEEMMQAEPDANTVRHLWHTFRYDLMSRQPLLQTQWQNYLIRK